MKKLFVVLFFIVASVSAQKTLNNYAYVIVPEQFSFQDSKDQYQLNSLTRFLLEKEGMKVFLDSEKIPHEYAIMDCTGLKLKMNKKSSMFRSKVDFELRDCYNNLVFQSELGESRSKEYKEGYQESVRKAFESFKEMNYTYIPQPAAEIPVAVTTAAVISNQESSNVSKLIYANKSDLFVELVLTGENYLGTVKSSKSIDYVAGDVICKLHKTSLPNIFKAEWKDAYGNFINTIAYFNELDELNIDFVSPTGISVMKFTKQ